jgi:DNA mismatch endonuclease (patch repair protein)
MRAVGHRNTAIEVCLQKVLRKRGIRYQSHRVTVGTKPDIVLVSMRIAIFVDGCWWHGCPRHYVAPVHNAAYWRSKLERNRARDLRDSSALRRAGWRVLRFWGCDVEAHIDAVAKTILRTLGQPNRPRVRVSPRRSHSSLA